MLDQAKEGALKATQVWILVLALALAFFGLSAPVRAQSVYLGLKGGPVISGVSGMDGSENIGLLLGWDFWTLGFGSVAAELEGTTTILEGDVTIPEFFSGTWTLDSVGLWLAYRTPHALYAKGKLGLEYVDVEVTQSGKGFSDSGVGASWGFGAGWRINEAYSLEAEYAFKTDLELAGDQGDVYSLSLGMNFNF
jgi:Outer membrane protein beta-barrel domain